MSLKPSARLTCDQNWCAPRRESQPADVLLFLRALRVSSRAYRPSLFDHSRPTGTRTGDGGEFRGQPGPGAGDGAGLAWARRDARREPAPLAGPTRRLWRQQVAAGRVRLLCWSAPWNLRASGRAAVAEWWRNVCDGRRQERPPSEADFLLARSTARYQWRLAPTLKPCQNDEPNGADHKSSAFHPPKQEGER